MPLALRITNPESPPESLAPLSPALETLIGYRYGLVQAWRQIVIDFDRNGLSKEAATAAFLGKHPGVSRATLYRWDAALRRDVQRPPDQRVGLRVLLDHRKIKSEPGSANPVASGGVDHPAWQYFVNHYNAMPPQTLVTCYHITKAEALRQGWHWPSLRTVQLRVADPVFQVHATYFRLGAREWERQFGHKIPRRFDQYRSGEWVMSDFHELDVFCRRSASDPTIVRPLVMAVIDIRSRKVALHLTEHENQRAIQAGLAKWIKANGAPMHWTLDNGKTFRSLGVSGGRPTTKRIENESYLTSMAGQLGIAVHFSINYNPNGKSICERFFGTLETMHLRGYASWCGPHKDDTFKAASKLAQTEPDKCPTLDQVAASIDRFVEEIYHVRPHAGLARDLRYERSIAQAEGVPAEDLPEDTRSLTPNQAFERFDPIPLTVAPPALLAQLTMLTARAKVTSMGVIYKGIQYTNYQGLFDHMGQEVLLRIPDDQAGLVLVCDLKTHQPICEARNARLDNAGVDRQNVEDGMRLKRTTARAIKKVRTVNPRDAIKDVADLALQARAAEVRDQIAQAKNQATGTHDTCGTGGANGSLSPPVIRNVKPLRPDLMARLDKAVSAPPQQPPRKRNLLEELADMEESQCGTGVSPVKKRSLLEKLDD